MFLQNPLSSCLRVKVRLIFVFLLLAVPTANGAPLNASGRLPIQALISPRNLSDETKKQLLSIIEQRFGNRLRAESRQVSSTYDRNLYALVRESLGYALEYDGSIEAKRKFQPDPKTNEQLVRIVQQVNGLSSNRKKPWAVPDTISTITIPGLPKKPGIRATDKQWQVFDFRPNASSGIEPKLFSINDCAPSVVGGPSTTICSKTGGDLREGGRWFFSLSKSEWDGLMGDLTVAARRELLRSSVISDALDSDIELIGLAETSPSSDPCALPKLAQEVNQWEAAFAAPLQTAQIQRIQQVINATSGSSSVQPQLVVLDWFNRDYRELEIESLVQCISKKDWPDHLYFHGQNVLRVISGYLSALGGSAFAKAVWPLVKIEPISPAMTSPAQKDTACRMMTEFVEYMARLPEQKPLWQDIQALNCNKFRNVDANDPQTLHRTPMLYIRSVLHHYLVSKEGPVIVTASYRTGGQYDMIPSQPLSNKKTLVSAVQDEGVVVERAGDEPQTSIVGRLSSGAFLLVSTADDENPGRRFGCSDRGDKNGTPSVSCLAPGRGFTDGLCRYSVPYTSFATPAIATQILLAQLYWMGEGGGSVDALMVRKRLVLASHPVPDWIGKFAAPGIPLLSRLLDMSDGTQEYLLICHRDLRQRCDRYNPGRFEVQVVLTDGTKIKLGDRWGKARYAGFSFSDNRLLYIQDLGAEIATGWNLEEREIKEVIFTDTTAEKKMVRTLSTQDLKQEAITEVIWP